MYGWEKKADTFYAVYHSDKEEFLLYNNSHFSVIAENTEGTMAYWLLLHMAFVWNKSSHVETYISGP